jgi:hypothetical protein
MSDLAITSSAVRGTRSFVALASTSLSAGAVVFRNSSGKLQKADPTDVNASRAEGITISKGGIDQPVTVHAAGNLTIDAVLTAGTFYYVSPGGICPFADLFTGCRVIQVGYAISTTWLVVNIIDTGIVLP